MKLPMCVCCGEEFIPVRSRVYCNPCGQAIERLRRRSREQVAELERRNELTLRRAQLAHSYPFLPEKE